MADDNDRSMAVPSELPAPPLTADIGSAFWDRRVMGQGWSLAQALARSKMVPDHFKGDPDSIFVVIAMAKQRGEDPLMLLQNVYMVHGRPGWMTEYLVARARREGIDLQWTTRVLGEDKLKVPPASKGKNPHRGGFMPNIEVVCSIATDPTRSVSVSAAEAISAGWTDNEKYLQHPERMLRWRAASYWISLYASQIKHGLPTVEDLETEPKKDPDEHVVENPVVQRGAAGLAAKLKTPTGAEVDFQQVFNHGLADANTAGGPKDPMVSTTPDDRPAMYTRIRTLEALLPKGVVEEVRGRYQVRALTARRDRPTLVAMLAEYEAMAPKHAPPKPEVKGAPEAEGDAARRETEVRIRRMYEKLGHDISRAVWDEVFSSSGEAFAATVSPLDISELDGVELDQLLAELEAEDAKIEAEAKAGEGT